MNNFLILRVNKVFTTKIPQESFPDFILILGNIK